MATVRVNINARGDAVPKQRPAKPGDDVEFRVAGNSVVLCFAEGVFPDTRYEVCRNTTKTIRVEDDANDRYKYRIDVCDNGDCDKCAQKNPAPCDHIRPTWEEDPPEMIID